MRQMKVTARAGTLVGPERGRQLRRSAIPWNGLTFEAPDFHDAPHRVDEEETAAGERGNGRADLCHCGQLHDALPADPRQDPEVRGRRAQRAVLPPKQIPGRPLGHKSFRRHEHGVMRSPAARARERATELLASRGLVTIGDVHLSRHPNGDFPVRIDVPRRAFGLPTGQLQTNHAVTAVSRADGEPDEIDEAVGRFGRAEGCDGGTQAREVAAEPGEAPSPGPDRLDEPDVDGGPYRPRARHDVKYYIWSDLFG